jgi:hypothetical protein
MICFEWDLVSYYIGLACGVVGGMWLYWCATHENNPYSMDKTRRCCYNCNRDAEDVPRRNNPASKRGDV